jgi:hypothetical protein
MSKKPAKRKPDKAKTPPAPDAEVAESDLWDLDSDGISPDSKVVQEREKPESTPPRRNVESNILSKKTIERTINLPVVTPTKESPSWDADEKVAEKPEPGAPAEETPAENEREPSSKPDAVAIGVQAFFASTTKTEKIAVSALFAALALAATFILIHFSSRVPTYSDRAGEIDFPVRGKLIEISSATTYWRKPVTSGENPDVVRRGTALIPVVKLTLHAKSSAIRVFFRNEEDLVIGDGISRNVSGDAQLIIPATAGFDDPGMHAAYRTGENEPWIVQVFESPSRDADGKDLRKVLETQISTDIR